MMFLTNSDGKKSMTVTLSIVAFVVVMVKLLLNNSAIQIGGFAYAFGSIDATEIAAVLSPILGTYAFRRYTDMRFGPTPGPFGSVPGSYENTMTTTEEEVGSDLGSKPGDGRA
jgi:hypothetical protein